MPWLPYPLKSGGHQGLFNGVTSVKDDFDIYIVYNATEMEDWATREFLEIVPNAKLIPYNPLSKKNRRGKIASALKSIISNYIHSKKAGNNKVFEKCSEWKASISPMNADWLDFIDSLFVNHHFDIIQVEMPWLISMILTLPKNVPTIYVHHELGFVKRGLEKKELGNSAYVRACCSFSDLVEIELLNMYDAVITVSSIDKDKLVDNGVIVPVYPSFSILNIPDKISSNLGNGKLLSFVGPDSHSPNFVGITWFLENCWNKLRSIDSSYKLRIIGEWSKDHIEEYSHLYPGVEFLGFVDNLAESIKGTIMIVPITIGSGIRMKILEACSIGVPFISTSVGAEGIPVVSGKHCYIADTPNDFINSIVRLQQTEIQKEFVLHAREMVEQNYSKDALRKNRLSIYRDILKE